VALGPFVLKPDAGKSTRVQLAGFNDHLECEDGSHETSHDSPLGCGPHLLSNELACEEVLVDAVHREVANSWEDTIQEMFQKLQDAATNTLIAENVNLSTSSGKEELDRCDDGDKDGHDEEQQCAKLQEEAHRPEAALCTTIPLPFMSSAAAPAAILDASTDLGQCIWAAHPWLINKSSRTSEETSGPESVEEQRTR